MIRTIYKNLRIRFPKFAYDLKKITAPVRLYFDNRIEVEGNFQGNQFLRFKGLEQLIAESEGKTVIDIGMSDGLIAYEFARNGSSLIHGLEIDEERVRFAKRLFSNVPVKIFFKEYNLAVEKDEFINSKHFLKRYDIVLFLGVYHHLKRQMNDKDLKSLVKSIISLSDKVLAVRTNLLDEIEPMIYDQGFKKIKQNKNNKISIGKLGLYERCN